MAFLLAFALPLSLVGPVLDIEAMMAQPNGISKGEVALEFVLQFLCFRVRGSDILEYECDGFDG